MAEWKEPIYDRTQADIDYAKAQLAANINNVDYKGCFNVKDVSRIEDNSKYLSDTLNKLYYFNLVDTRTYNQSTVLAVSNIERIINNVRVLWSKYYTPNGALSLPTTLLTYEQVNALEKNQYLIKEMLDDMISSFRECGTFTCGEE